MKAITAWIAITTFESGAIQSTISFVSAELALKSRKQSSFGNHLHQVREITLEVPDDWEPLKTGPRAKRDS